MPTKYTHSEKRITRKSNNIPRLELPLTTVIVRWKLLAAVTSRLSLVSMSAVSVCRPSSCTRTTINGMDVICKHGAAVHFIAVTPFTLKRVPYLIVNLVLQGEAYRVLSLGKRQRFTLMFSNSGEDFSLRVGSACSPVSSRGFLQVLRFPFTVRKGSNLHRIWQIVCSSKCK